MISVCIKGARRAAVFFFIFVIFLQALPIQSYALAFSALSYTSGSVVATVSGTTSDSRYWKGTDGWKYDAASRHMTIVDLIEPNAAFSADGDVTIITAGTSCVRSITANGDITIMGTGILIVDELVSGGILSSSGVALFIKNSTGEYVLQNSAYLMDENHTLVAGRTYIMPSGTTINVAANLITVDTDDYYYSSMLTIPFNTTLILENGANIILEQRYHNQVQFGYYSGKITVAGTLKLSDNSSISAKRWDSANPGTFLQENIYYSTVKVDNTALVECAGNGYFSNVAFDIDLLSNSFRLALANCDVKFNGPVSLKDKAVAESYGFREIQLIDIGKPNAVKISFNDAAPLTANHLNYTIDSVDIRGNGSVFEVYNNLHYNRIENRDVLNCAAVFNVKKGVTGTGTLKLSNGISNIAGAGINVGTFDANGCPVNVYRSNGTGAAITATNLRLDGARLYAEGIACNESIVATGTVSINDSHIVSIGGIQGGADLENAKNHNLIFDEVPATPSYNYVSQLLHQRSADFDAYNSDALIRNLYVDSNLEVTVAPAGYSFDELYAVFGEDILPITAASRNEFGYILEYFEISGIANGIPTTWMSTKTSITPVIPEDAVIYSISAVYLEELPSGSAGGLELSNKTSNTGKGVLGGQGSSSLCSVGVHAFGNYSSVGAATCSTPGTRTATCGVCGATATQTYFGAHSFSGGGCGSCGASDPTYKAPKPTPSPSPSPSAPDYSQIPPSPSPSPAPIPAPVALSVVIELLFSDDGNGNATLTLSDSDTDKLIDTLQNSGTPTKKVVFNAPATLGTDGEVKSVNLTLPSSLLSAIAAANVPFVFVTGAGGMQLDADTIAQLVRAASESGASVITLTMDFSAELTEAQARIIGERPYVLLRVTVDAEEITTFIGSIIVTFPFDAQADEHYTGYVLMRVSPDGTAVEVPCEFSDGKAVFSRQNFSVYYVEYDTSRVWDDPFADVIWSDWFYPDVRYAYQNGLFNGTGKTTFSPQSAMTRGMVVTVLGRLAGIDVADYAGETFGDVDAFEYYSPYIKWAAEKDIVEGVGGGSFAPDANISRQDLAVIFSRYVEKMEIPLKQTMQIVTFADSADIADYASEAAQAMARSGIINGKPGGIFDPKAEATRAEVAAVLHRFCESVTQQ